MATARTMKEGSRPIRPICTDRAAIELNLPYIGIYHNHITYYVFFVPYDIFASQFEQIEQVISAAVQFLLLFRFLTQTDRQTAKEQKTPGIRGIRFFFPPFLSTAIKKIVGDAALLLNEGSEIAWLFFPFPASV